MAPSSKSRREFLTQLSAAALASSVPALASSGASPQPIKGSLSRTEEISLDGDWSFRFDSAGAGEAGRWQQPESSSSGWTHVRVPHTWQISPGSEDHRGLAWYRRSFDGRPEWVDKTVRIEFEAVFHSATVWINGKVAGKHLRKGYTTFAFDITSLIRLDAQNVIVVEVDNSFDESMLPRGRSSDWAHDGGIYRPVRLLITPQVFIEGIFVDAKPDLAANRANLEVSAVVRNAAAMAWEGQLAYRVREEDTGKVVLEQAGSPVRLEPGQARTFQLRTGTLDQPKLWHFDHPYLYILSAILSASTHSSHQVDTTFGARSIEIKDGAFHLNGKQVRLMGVERMAGSNPEWGMAEPGEWIRHDHDDLKHLNCSFTRVHWQQDRRVLDYCDREGILLQSEVPTWGPNTFKNMGADPLPELMQNGLEQLREMIDRDRNHPSIFSWGLCNEIGGQNPPAYQFAKRMREEARKLDPGRLCSYASNSLQKTPANDVSSLMDFVEWNEYYESWYGGTPEDLRRNLQEIHQAFPGKPIVISEYGYCACTADRPEGDGHRIKVLQDHTQVCREMDFVGGLIFFCYNDYRTHIGDKGAGAAKQRVHGVVDLYGNRKPSYEVLRRESSPIDSFEVTGHPDGFSVTVHARKTIPAHLIEGYKLRAVFYGYGEIPLERREAAVPLLAPGEQAIIKMQFTEKLPQRVEFDVLRPNGFSAYTYVWRE